MVTVANIALVVAVAVTGLLVMLQQSNAQLKGPDSAGAAIVYFALTPFRWLALAIALGIAIAEGGFSWISGSVAAQVIPVALVHVAAGAASVILLAAGSDRTASWSLRAAGIVVAYGWPLALIAYLGRLFNASLGAGIGMDVMQMVLLAALALATVAAIVAAIPLLQARARRAARRRMRAAEAASEEEVVADYAVQRLAELQALDEASPLSRWLEFTGDNEPSDVQMQALAKVAARPSLVPDLAALLAGDRVVEALAYIRWQLAGSPALLARPVRDALLRIAASVRWRIENCETPFPGQFELETGQAVDLAIRFHGTDADFRPALIATRDALDLATDRAVAPENRPRLDSWLAKH